MSTFEQGLEGLVERVIRRVLREELAAARTPTTEMVTPAQFGGDNAIAVTTVRAMVADGRIAPEDVTRIGRLYRIRRGAEIRQPAASRATAAAENPAQRAARILGGGK